MQYYGDLRLTDCSVLRCGDHGVNLADLNRAEIAGTLFAGNNVALATRDRKTPVTIAGSAFVQSRKGHIDHKVGDEMNAQGNWWGTANPQQIASLIQDGRDLPGRGQVDARNFLTAMPEGVGSSLWP